MSDLNPRQRVILRAVVFEYVTGAEPVGSELLTKKYDLGVRSATVRNELAEISEMGYLAQPHTSAGRIPSDLGYRFFVDHMANPKEAEPDARQQVKTATEEGDLLQTMLSETTVLLSRMTRLMSAATTVSNSHLQVKTAVLSALGADRALLVVILNNGHVENKLIECPHGLTLPELGTANETLIAAVSDKPLRALLRQKAPGQGGSAPLDKFLATAWQSIRSIARALSHGRVHVEGEEYLFGQPEFRRDDAPLKALLEALDSEEMVQHALAPTGSTAQTVTIGSEHSEKALHSFSVLRQSFYVGDSEAGSVALIGPTRMDYESNMPLLSFATQALSQTLTRMFKS